MNKLVRSLSGLGALSAMVAFGFVVSGCGDKDDNKKGGADAELSDKQKAAITQMITDAVGNVKTASNDLKDANSELSKALNSIAIHPDSFKNASYGLTNAGAEVKGFENSVKEVLVKLHLASRATDGTYTGLKDADAYKAMSNLTVQGVHFSNAAGEAMKTAAPGKTLKVDTTAINYPTTRFTFVAA
jgi:hypothetical protein